MVETAGRERGATVIEFALIASLMFLLLLGILSYGEVLADYVQLRFRAGEVARQVSLGENAQDRQAIFIRARDETDAQIEGFMKTRGDCGILFTSSSPDFNAADITITLEYRYGADSQCRIMPAIGPDLLPDSVSAEVSFTVQPD